jgi:hypothetical protein
VAQEITALIGRRALQGLDLEALEMAARRQALQLAARAIERCLNADTSDYAGPHVPCRCGSSARYVDRRRKTFQSVLGELQLERAYYHCSGCQQGFFPRDRALGLENTSLSPAVTRMIGAVGALVSFQEGSQLLQELAGVSVEAKQVERVAERLGEDVAEDERRESEPVGHDLLPHTLYLGLDGTGIPMRASELLGRTGKQADGSSKTREVKLCTTWSAESRDSGGLPVRDAGSVTYSAAIESAASPLACRSEFTDRVLREATRRRFSEATRTVVMGDGALWIWNIAQELFPRAIQIVDRFHAKERLSTVAKAVYGPADPRAQRWTQRRHAELDDGRFDALLKALRRHACICEEARRCLSYLQTNRSRMRYPEFQAQGLCTSSGVVEAGCKTVIGTRLKRAGMHCTLRGSNAIIALRCSRLSGRFEDFWERRSLRKAAA